MAVFNMAGQKVNGIVRMKSVQFAQLKCMWKFFYFESQSWSGSFLNCRIGFCIRNDFVHVQGSE